MTRRMWILLAIFLLGCIAEAVIVPLACGQCVGGMCPTQGRGIGIGVGISGWSTAVPATSRPQLTQQPAQQVAKPCFVRIVAEEPSGRIGSGSGTIVGIVGNRAYVITCCHGTEVPGVKIGVDTVTKGGWWANIKGRESVLDFAMLEITNPGVPAIEISSTIPQIGDSVFIGGFGGGRWKWNQGRITTWCGPSSAYTGNEQAWMNISTPSVQGDSGGPVIDSRGYLIGVIIAGGDGETTAVCIPRHLARINSWINSTGEQPPVGGNGAWTAPHVDGASGGQDVPPPPVPPMVPVEKPACDAIALLKAEIQSQIDGLRADLLEFRKQPAQLPPGESERIANISDALVAVSERTEQIEQRTSSEKLREAIREAVPVVAETGWTAAAKSALPGVLTALGWSTPPSAAIAAAWFGLKLLRRRRQKKSQAAEATTTTQQPTVIVQESKPLPQVVVRDPEYIPFEVPTKRQKAMEMAQDYFVQKHPGAASTIEVLKQYTDQFESGLKSPQ